MADFVSVSEHPDDLSKQVRWLGLYFVVEYESSPGGVRAVTREPRPEQLLVGNVQRTPYEIGLSIDPHLAQHILGELDRVNAQMTVPGQMPVVITSAELRLPFKRFWKRR